MGTKNKIRIWNNVMNLSEIHDFYVYGIIESEEETSVIRAQRSSLKEQVEASEFLRKTCVKSYGDISLYRYTGTSLHFIFALSKGKTECGDESGYKSNAESELEIKSGDEKESEKNARSEIKSSTTREDEIIDIEKVFRNEPHNIQK